MEENLIKMLKSIPFDKANKIKDKEGFVEVIGFGKVHIDNWNK